MAAAFLKLVTSSSQLICYLRFASFPIQIYAFASLWSPHWTSKQWFNLSHPATAVITLFNENSIVSSYLSLNVAPDHLDASKSNSWYFLVFLPFLFFFFWFFNVSSNTTLAIFSYDATNRLIFNIESFRNFMNRLRLLFS